MLATPIGQMFLPMITQMENQMKGGGGGSSFLPGWEGGQAPASNAAPIAAASAAASVLPQPTQAAAAAASASASAPQAPAIARSNSSSVDAPTALSTLCSASHRHRSLVFSSANTSSVGVSTRPLLSLDDKAVQFKDMLLKQNATIAAAASGASGSGAAPLSATELSVFEATIAHLRDNPKDSVAPPPHEAIALFGAASKPFESCCSLSSRCVSFFDKMFSLSFSFR